MEITYMVIVENRRHNCIVDKAEFTERNELDIYLSELISNLPGWALEGYSVRVLIKPKKALQFKAK